MTRRPLLRSLALLLALFLVAAGCSDEEASTTESASAIDSSAQAGDSSGPAETSIAEPDADVEAADLGVACDPYPSYSEGNFYINDASVTRDDATEDVEGLSLFVRVTLVDSADCARLTDQVVDVWSANPAGQYSGVVNPGAVDGAVPDDDRWLRSRHTTNSAGAIELNTIYPGWTPGSPPQLSMTTPISDAESYTWRVVLDDEFSDSVYVEAPYADRGVHEVRSADSADPATVVTPVRRGDGAFIEVVVAIDRENLRQRPVSADVAGPSAPSSDDPAIDDAGPMNLIDVAQEVQEMFNTAARDLGVDGNDLFMAFEAAPNGTRPDLDQITTDLGVTREALAEALPLLAAGAPTLD